MANVVNSVFERRVFTAPDGRVLGNEVRIDEWYHPFSGEAPNTFTEEIVATAAFRDLPEAGQWVDDLIREQQIERVRANGGTKLVFIL